MHADHLDERHDALVAASAATVEELRTLLAEGRETAEAQADWFRAECQATETETVAGMSSAIAKASAHAFDERVRAMDRRTAVLVALGLAAALVAGATGGWWTGVTTTRAAIGETEVGLRAAFRDGPESARVWLELMSWNDVRAAVVRCRDAGRIREEAGRKSCPLLLWVSPPVAAPEGASRL
ncbi:hypothetical protein SAMN04488144_14513 [Methylobacterium sp. 190mf]|uniref:hypothetical protein n=1 Tax=Methylobacterium sp. 190mf TaxID=1761798 RepID=UPI00089E773B|nr:hypothetical protein [Methylobacterium sp. 190mf]SEG69631.1 hypothetical protein SAMN04488144_14513 [Methylobacterium sp. 190mf]